MLRKPWGLPLQSAEDELESLACHVLAQQQSSAIGVGRIHAINETEWQIRYMAVLPAYQGQGIGRQILSLLEHHALEQGAEQILLHAREKALGFYQQQQYLLVKKSHVLFGEIQHYEMCKSLQRPRRKGD